MKRFPKAGGTLLISTIFTSLERAGDVEAGRLAVTIKRIQCRAGLILLRLLRYELLNVLAVDEDPGASIRHADPQERLLALGQRATLFDVR